MLIPGIVFIVVLAGVYGAYWMFVLEPENRERTKLQRRLKSEDPTQASVRLLKKTTELSTIEPINRLLIRCMGVLGPIKKIVDDSGLNLSVSTFLLMSMVSAFGAAIGAQIYAGVTWVAALAGVGALCVPYLVVTQLRTRRIRQFEEQFPEAIELISRSMRAGHAFATGLQMVADEMPSPAGPEFKLLYERQNYGAQLPDALRSFASRIPSLDARFFVTAVLTQREAGGNLSEVLDRLATVMRERFRIKREVRVKSAHGRMTAYVLAGMPPALAGMMFMSSPEQFKLLTTDPLGFKMIMAGLVLETLGFLIVRKLVDIQYLTPMSMLLTLVAVFMSIALLTGVTASMALTSRATRKRLLAVTRGPQALVMPEILPLSSQEPSGIWSDAARYLPRSPKEMSRLKMRLMRAGFRHQSAPVVYSLLEMVGPFVVGGTPLLFYRGPQAILGALFAAVITFFTPGMIVGQRLQRRRREIENGLPDALDLLVVCIEAGSGIDQAIMKAGEELALAYPALGDELRILTMEVRAGKPRLDAFKNFASRTKVDDVRALVAMLIQTDRFGTSIGQALRTHSEVSRTRRRQRAEEQAQKIGVKLVFPLVLFFFPAFYIVVLGPAIIQFVRQFMEN